MRKSRIIAVGAMLAAVVTVAGAASANWIGTGLGAAGANAAAIPAPDAPVATGAGESADVSWSAVTWPGPPPSYTVTRVTSDGTPSPAGGTCAGTVTDTSCTDSGVAPGMYTYKVLAKSGGWTGPTSEASTSTEVFPILRSLKLTWSAIFSNTDASPVSFCGGPGQPACANQPSLYPVQVRWGNPATSSGQSGLGFNGGALQTVDSATPFSAGTLTHINFPVTLNTVETTSKLTITAVLTASDGTVLFSQAIPVTFGIDETPNTAPCKYPSATPCADAITIQNVGGLTATNTVDGTTYRFSILGFRKSLSDTTNVTQLISDESRTNSVLLVARFDVVG